jgi:hypothetical protein
LYGFFKSDLARMDTALCVVEAGMPALQFNQIQTSRTKAD